MLLAPLPLLAPAPDEFRVGVGAAVPEKRPDTAEFLDLAEVEVAEEDFLGVGGGAGDEFAIGVGDERAAPELGVAFGARAVDGGDITAVGHGMSALDGFPGIVLGLAVGGFSLGQPADGGRVDEEKP